MDIFDVLTLIGGLCLFLYGMNVMGDALERRAGSRLSTVIGKLTTNKLTGFLTGLGVTAVIQSSSATTVMVVGFVNSGLMSFKQSIGVIMGANIGTTVTAWILSLGGIESSNIFMQLLKPTSFTPVLALIGIVFYMFSKSSKKRDTGLVLLGFAVLMFGMDTMTKAVSGLKEVEGFRQLFVAFKNPIMGVLAGAVLTAVIQSSSASVGILQALTTTGQISYGAAFPIIMGQNIGTCVTAILSSFGTNRNAKRVATAHLCFNIIGTTVLMIVLYIVKATISPAILDMEASHFGIAVSHSVFNILCTALLLPTSSLLEKLVCRLVPYKQEEDTKTELDERLLSTPAIALDTCRNYAIEMGSCAGRALKDSVYVLYDYKPAVVEEVRKRESKTDHYEDVIGNYLVMLSAHRLSDDESARAAMLLRVIGDFERISDHALNLCESAIELKDKDMTFSEEACEELKTLTNAVLEIFSLTLEAFRNNDSSAIKGIQPLEEVIDDIKEAMRSRHIKRLQKGGCGLDVGFIWSDLLTNLERVSDHCLNIAGCIAEASEHHLNMHDGKRRLSADNDAFRESYNSYFERFRLPAIK